MKKLSVKDLIEFRRKSIRGKKTFIENMKSNKIEVPSEGGGDYWISSLSAVCNAYKDNDVNVIEDKIYALREKINNTKHSITKNMYQRNITILQTYKTMDIKQLRPNGKLSFLKKPTVNSILTIKGLQVEAKASHIYTFGKKNEEKIGAVWFTAKVNGYRMDEVGIFCEILYRFLKNSYSKQYQLSPQNCVVVDMLSGNITDYSVIESGVLSSALTPIIDEINKLL